MKKLTSYLKLGVILLSMILTISCSKEEGMTTTPDNQKAIGSAMGKTFTNGIHGNEFVSGQINSIMSHNNGMPNFANNTGNNNFTGSSPGSSGGDGISGSGSFTIFNTTYPITIGGIEGWGDGYFSIYLFDLNNLDEANAIVFDIQSPTENEIGSGDYYYSDVNVPYTFHWAQVILGFEDYFEFASGTISISHSSNSYSINIEGMLENGGSITGWYAGTLIDLGGEPEPPNNSTMSASTGSQSWLAESVYAHLDSQMGVLDITGSQAGGTTISMKLDAEMVSPGVQLTIPNNGVYYMNISMQNGNYYADSYAVVNITTYTSSAISGTFEFNGTDYANNSIAVTNGIFTNVAIN